MVGDNDRASKWHVLMHLFASMAGSLIGYSYPKFLNLKNIRRIQISA